MLKKNMFVIRVILATLSFLSWKRATGTGTYGDATQGKTQATFFFYVPSQYCDIVVARWPRRGCASGKRTKRVRQGDWGPRKKENTAKLFLSSWKFTHLTTKLLCRSRFLLRMRRLFRLHFCVLKDPFVVLLPRRRIPLATTFLIHLRLFSFFFALNSRSLFFHYPRLPGNSDNLI